MSQDSDRAGFASNRSRQYLASHSGASKIVSRPAPQGPKGDARTFQLNQIRRRYNPRESTGVNGETVLKLRLVPSDPDFPYDLQGLDCTITIPASFPTHKHSLRVTNHEMGRGYQINIENGFDAIVSKSPNSTILQHLYTLDRDLETLLAVPKAETVKIMVHAPERRGVESSSKGNAVPVMHATTFEISTQQSQSIVVKPTYTSQQISEAGKIRSDHVRQLEARMGRLSLFSRHKDGITFAVPVEPRRNDLPASIRDVQTIKLIVPALYNLEPCRIELSSVKSLEASSVEEKFQKLSTTRPEMSLFALINQLSQKMHLMVKARIKQQPLISPQVQDPSIRGDQPSPEPRTSIVAISDTKSHVIVIPRPPEWSLPDANASETDEDSSWDEESRSDADTESEKEDMKQNNDSAHRPERGILMSFPNLELIGIELMELVTLSLTVKCDRCKEIMDVPKLHDSSESPAMVKVVPCKKCSNQLSIGYRMDLIHANCIRAGYLDLDGCTVVDMLTSYFKPTCAQCSTPYPLPGIPSVRGDAALAICRECHKQMNFKISEIKFLLVSAAAVRASQAPRKKREQLGIRAGEQLPNRGRCSHYAKSYRWFRFSCCSKVFPCDRCHDAAESHPNEHANRMICGHCSREQNYRPEDCGICHASLIARKGTGFWEGGKGTRDKTRMSRKDPRKYKRRPGTAPRAGT